MKQSKICEVFSLFANISVNEAVKYMPLIYAAEKDVKKNIKNPMYLEEYAYELELLCGAKVFYDYLLSRASVENTSQSTVKVGSVQTSTQSKLSENVSYAKELYTKYKLLSANLFYDKEFLFGSV